MNIYQEVYDAVTGLQNAWLNNINETLVSQGRLPLPKFLDLLTLEQKEEQWIYVANMLQYKYSPEVVKVAKEKYPILQQIIQNNESEVRS